MRIRPSNGRAAERLRRASPVHGVLTFYGVVLLDNALLEPLAAACAEEGHYEFLFMALPLNVRNGTGSPANPIAMF